MIRRFCKLAPTTPLARHYLVAGRLRAGADGGPGLAVEPGRQGAAEPAVNEVVARHSARPR